MTEPVSSLKDASVILEAVAKGGLLLLSDPKRANAITALTGEFPKGSWWSHPRANDIYAILQKVERSPDVAFVKLISGKVTMVHRSLWPALLGVVTAREDWQMAGLPPGAAQWLEAVDLRAPGATDAVPVSRTVAKEIEARLLAIGHSAHGAAGKHETRLETWPDWAARVGCAAPLTSPAGKQALEAAVLRVGGTAADLRWASGNV